MNDQYDRRDPRAGGGQEYAAQPARQPVARAAPGYEHHQQDAPWPVQQVQAPVAPQMPPVHHVQVPVAPQMPPARQPVAAPVQAVPPDLEEGVVVLSKAYRAHDIMVDRITLRRPKAREIAKCGNPLRFVQSPDGRVQDIDIKWDVVLKYIPLLATPAIPPSTDDEFDYFDLDACAAALGPFFVKLATTGT